MTDYVISLPGLKERQFKADDYAVSDDGRLELHAGYRVVATFPPGSWHGIWLKEVSK